MSPGSSDPIVTLDSSGTRCFKHNPLRNEADSQEVRLLIREDVQPSERDLLRFRLEHRHLDDISLEYNALSYTWHSAREPRRILINDSLYVLPSNLHLFLERLVKEEPMYIWIDQISIDQTNTLERNHQVQMMSEIYSRAKQVIIWLGSEDAEGQADDRMAAQIFKGGEHMWRTLLTQSRTHGLIDTSDQNPEFMMADQLIASGDAAITEFVELRKIPVYVGETAGTVKVRRGIAALYKFFRKRYWSRLWIIQEILLASNVVVWATTGLIPVSDLVSFGAYHGRLLRDRASTNALPWGLMGRASNILARMGPDQTQKSTKDVGFFEHLVTYSFFDCADARDRIYGLQGIVRINERMLVDYSKSIEEVLIDAAVHMAFLIDPSCETRCEWGVDGYGRSEKGLAYLVPYLGRNMLDNWESQRQSLHEDPVIEFDKCSQEAQVYAVCLQARKLREPVPRGECFMMSAWFRYMLSDILMNDGKAAELWDAQCFAGLSLSMSNEFWDGITQMYMNQTPVEKRKYLKRDDWMHWASSRQVLDEVSNAPVLL